MLKNQTLYLVLFLMLCGIANLDAQYDSLDHDGYMRTYLVHLPQSEEVDQALPVVLAMHGGFGSAANLQNQSGLSLKADKEGFIVVYPEGIKDPILGIRTWNAGWCCGFASKSEVDDVGFIGVLIDTLFARYQIDTNRVYATGMSNGGFMSYRLACELPEQIAAIGPVASSMSIPSCGNKKPIPVIHFHSYLDGSVPFDGGIGNGVSSHHNTPLDSVAQIIGEVNHCDIKRDTVTDNNEFTHIRWDQCNCNVEIHQYITRDGGHSWPGGTKTPIGDPVSVHLSANDLMWEFFQRYSLDCPSTTAVKEDISGVNLKMYPNPVGDLLYFSWPVGEWGDVHLYNAMGVPLIYQSSIDRLDMSHLPPGIYYVLMRTPTFRTSRKIVKFD